MLRAVRAGMLMLSAAIVVTAAAEQRPNFSGKWLPVSPAEALAGGAQTVVHTDTTLRIIHGAEGDDHNPEFILDGKEHRRTMASHGSEIVTLYTATWKGDQLSIVSKSTYSNGNVLDQTQVWSLDQTGQLVVDLTESFTKRPKTSMKILYKKQ